MTATGVMTVLIIDDHKLFRCGLRMIVESQFAPADVREAGSTEEALSSDLAAPSLILLDIKLQGLNGIESMRLLQRRWPTSKIVVISSDASPSTIEKAYQQGAAAYSSKADSSVALVKTIEQVLAEPSPEAGVQRAVAVTAERLTQRQAEVLNYLDQGLTNKAIARKLDLSENTVRGHVQSVLTYMNATSRSEAVFIARKSGLLS